MGQYLKDRKGFKKYNILDGKKDTTNPFTLRKSLNGDTLLYVGWKPYLTFDFVLVSHQFNPTPYFRTYHDRKTLRDKVWKLHKLGFGYTKIHHYLIDNGYQIGKSRTCVDSIIKKIKIRQEFLNQSIYKSGFQDFRVEMLEVNK